MARGKYRQRSCAQRARRLRDEIGALEADVAGEERALREAREQAAKTRAARRRLGAETARTSTVLAPKEAEAARGACATAGAWRDLKAASVELERADRALSDPRQGRARADLLAAAVAGGFVLDNRAVAHAGSSPEYQELIFRARVGTSVPMRRGIDMTGWLPTDLRDVDTDPNGEPVSASGVPRADRAAISPYAQATVHDQTREALWSFVVPPWTRGPDGADAPALRAALGATSSGAADLPDSPFPGVAPRAMTIDRPWRHTPWLAAPEDAADLAYWYHRAAWAQSWAHQHTPIPFWLPAEHSSGFPRAKPLPDDVDLRLPFPLVCALFAQPWELPATRPAAELPFATLLLARGQAVDSRVQAVVEHRRRVLVGRDELPTALECVEHFGAEVEGLLLRADRDHQPTDDFAWCLSLSHPWGLPLGRVVVPARRSSTAWRQAADNVLGGVCLSHWHTPDSSSSTPAPRRDHLQTRAVGDTDVRVLDIAATSPGQCTSAAPGGSQRRAHLRRGTWRRQWVGPGRTRQRPTWVRDTVVRGNGSGGHQVYRLPRDQP